MASKMSLLSRRLIQASVRNYSAAAGAGGHAGAARQWKLASFLVAFPAVGLCLANAYLSHEHYHPPPFVAYEHLRIRTKRFPWGDGQKSLFHNSEVNALPSGYESEH